MTVTRPFGSQKNINTLYKALFFIFLSILLLLFEAHLEQSKMVRRVLNYSLSPVYLALDFSVKQYQTFREHLVFTSAQNLQLEQLQKQVLFLQQELRKTYGIIVEDQRLNAVLDAAPSLDTYVSARIIGEELTINNQQMILDKGSLHGIRAGMPVITKNGLAGQIVAVEIGTSRALLITDPRHATPVMVRRNSHRFIVNGEGRVRHLAAKGIGGHIDVKSGDILVTSGLGGRFPAGLPVARVETVTRRHDRSFLEIKAQPIMRPYISSFALIHKEIIEEIEVVPE